MIDFITQYDIIGDNCYFDNTRFDVTKWDYLKRIAEYNKPAAFPLFGGNPIFFSLDFINEAFKPVRNSLTNMIIRDQEFQFVQYMRIHPYFDATFDGEKYGYLLTYNFKK